MGWYIDIDKKKVVFFLDRILEKAVSLGMLSPTLIRMLTVREAAGINFQAANEKHE